MIGKGFVLVIETLVPVELEVEDDEIITVESVKFVPSPHFPKSELQRAPHYAGKYPQ